jgi:hypothetical protein
VIVELCTIAVVEIEVLGDAAVLAELDNCWALATSSTLAATKIHQRQYMIALGKMRKPQITVASRWYSGGDYVARAIARSDKTENAQMNAVRSSSREIPSQGVSIYRLDMAVQS